jgi:hypothetical protein
VAGPVFLTDKEFAVVRNNSNYKHIAFTRLDGSLRWLTSGNWDVLSIVGHSTESLCVEIALLRGNTAVSLTPYLFSFSAAISSLILKGL